MKTFAKIVSGTVACFFLVFASICSAQLSDLKQKALREDAAKLAKEIGVGEHQMYQNLALLYLAKQAQGVA